jgi:hypothetical protein
VIGVNGAAADTAMLQLYISDATPETVTLVGPVQVAAHAQVSQRHNINFQQHILCTQSLVVCVTMHVLKAQLLVY